MSKDPIRFRLTVYSLVFLAVLLAGAIGFKLIEGRSWIDAFYFIIVTMATVGYGDVTPASSGGKIFAIILIVLGVSTFLGVFANATELVLSRREKQVRVNKLSMVIGVFFSEVGTKLIRIFSDSDPHFAEIQKGMIVTDKWTHQDFLAVRDHLIRFQYAIEISRVDLKDLKFFLMRQRDFLVRLLENPMLLEHEFFTDLLQAVFHLTEELSYREDLASLPEIDQAHLAGDMKRAYHLLVRQWVDYMEYVKDNYPYLFSLAMRINPFDRQANPILK